MLTGWVLIVVLTHGLQPSQLQVFSGFATQADCIAAAQSTVATKDRWVCFRSTR